MSYYVTFGQKHRHEGHPKGGHPDGWVRINATTEDEARRIAFHVLGQQWSMLYSERDKPTTDMFPRGELFVL